MITLKFRKPKAFPCNGSSIWMDTKNVIPKVTEIRLYNVREYDSPTSFIEVDHNAPWEIYTDTGFEKGISKFLSIHFGVKFVVSFTEQGMQQITQASMEYNVTKNTEKLFNVVFSI